MKFDDIIVDDIGTWTQLCLEHKEIAEEKKLGLGADVNPIETICGCEGCSEVGDYYFDFEYVGDYLESVGA